MTRLFALVVAPLLIAGCAHADGTAPSSEQKPVVQQPPAEARQMSPAEAEALADFKTRVDAYVKLQQAAQAQLPRMPEETTPQVIDTHQRALEKRLAAERSQAKPGDILTPAVQKIFRDLLARVFAGREGQELKATILDDNPGTIPLRVNARYPDEVPLSTVPPQVLSSLPTLPKSLEYRFVGERLVLLDAQAHIIVDFMNDAFPR
jgi:hypothetical protein